MTMTRVGMACPRYLMNTGHLPLHLGMQAVQTALLVRGCLEELFWTLVGQSLCWRLHRMHAGQRKLLLLP